MKLKKVELENYRNHAHSILEFGEAPFIVIRGSNYSGKSSIGQGISMCLTPSTTGLDAQGRGFVRKIKRGSPKSVITLDIQTTKHLIEQSVTLNTNTSGRTSRSTCIDEPDWKPLPFDNFLKRYKDALMVVLNTDHFIRSMGEEQQKNLFAMLTLPESYEFPRDIIEAVEKALGEGAINFSGEPFAVIALGYKKLYDERSVVNRQVKEFTVPDPLPKVAGVDSVSMQAQLNTLRQQRQKISEEKDAAVKKEGETENKRTRLQTKIETLKTEVGEKKKRFDEIVASMLSEDALKQHQSVAAGKARLDAIVKERTVYQTTIAQLNIELARFEELPAAGSKCPTCDQVIVGDTLTKMKVDLQAEVDKATKDLADLNKESESLGKVDEAVAAIAKHEGAIKEKSELEKALTEKVTVGKQTRTELNALGESVDATAAFVAPLKEIEEKINGLIDQLRPVIAAEERDKEIKVRTEALAKLQAKAASVDELVKYFDKDGIKAKLLAEHIGGFENKMNVVMEAFGYKCSLSIDPYDFQVTNSKGDTVAISELSGSEELMCSVAIQCAVSRVANIGFIVADRMDTFLPSQRLKANRCLYKMATDGTLDQVIMIISDENTEAPKLNGSKFFFVDNGTVTQLQPAQ